MKVLIVTDEQVFNEFGSGCADVNAMRRMLKMFYDRGKATPSATTLRYVLLMGGATHDHRRLTPAMSSSPALTLPIGSRNTASTKATLSAPTTFSPSSKTTQV